MKKSARRLTMTLLIGCASTSAGCQATMQTTCAIAPKKPTLEILLSEDGGMCLGIEDTRALAHYINDLEFCAK